MDIEYRRDMNHNYMIVKGAGPDVPDDYETRVISANRIPGLLNCRMQYIDAEIWYSYDVTSLQKLTVFCESRKIGKSEITKILSEILRILEGLEDYLLDFRHLILSPSCVCMDFDTMEIRLMYVPFYCKDIRKSLRELTEYLLGCADHSDQRAIVLGYRFCHEVQENNTQLGDLMGVLYEKDRTEREPLTDEISAAEPEISIQYPKEEQADSRQNVGLSGKAEKPGLPGRPAVIAVFAGLLILAAVFAVLHTDLLRYISIYTICGIAAGICAAVLLVYLVREHRGNAKDMPVGRQEEIPEVRQEMKAETAQPNDMSLPVEKGDSGPALMEREDIPERDPRDELPVTMLLSSYRPARGPEDRWLLPTSEGQTGKHLTGDDILIGKNQQYVDMIIDSPAVSRIHARLRFRAGRYFIGDLSSRNGTTVNGEAVCGEEERVLSEGDVITFADVSYIFSADDGADCESRGGGV